MRTNSNSANESPTRSSRAVRHQPNVSSIWLLGVLLLFLILIGGIGFFSKNDWLLGGFFFACGFAVVSYLFHTASALAIRAERSITRRCSLHKRNVMIGMCSIFAGLLVFLVAEDKVNGLRLGEMAIIAAQLGFSVTIAGGFWTIFSLRSWS